MANQGPTSTLVTCYGRLSYPSLIKPRAYKGGKGGGKETQPFYQAALLIPKVDVLGDTRYDGKPYSPWFAGGLEKAKAVHDITKLLAFTREAELALFPSCFENGKPKKGALKSPIRDGDKPGPEEDEAPETQLGHWVIRTKSKRRPALLRADKTTGEVTDDEEIGNLFTPGYWVRLMISTYDATNTKPGVGFGLRMVQFVRQDAAFSGSGGKVDIDSIEDLPQEDLEASEDLGDME